MTAFDHAVVNVHGRMNEAAAQYERLGFTLTPRGYHTLGSINHLAVFGDSYLELLGYAPGEREKRAEMWEHPAGLTGLAFRTEDAAALHAHLRRKGVEVEPFKDFSRPVEVDNQERTASFRTFQIDRRKVENGRVFFCQHNSPELIWRPQWQTHANGATGIGAFTIMDEDPDRLATLLASVPGVADGGTLRAGRTNVRITRPADLAACFPGVTFLPSLEGGTMRMVALDFFTRSLEVTASYLAGHDVPHLHEQKSVTIVPNAASELLLRFIPEN